MLFTDGEGPKRLLVFSNNYVSMWLNCRETYWKSRKIIVLSKKSFTVSIMKQIYGWLLFYKAGFKNGKLLKKEEIECSNIYAFQKRFHYPSLFFKYPLKDWIILDFLESSIKSDDVEFGWSIDRRFWNEIFNLHYSSLPLWHNRNS